MLLFLNTNVRLKVKAAILHLLVSIYLLLAILVDPVNQSVGIITGLETISLNCTTQGVADRVDWERQDKNMTVEANTSSSYSSVNMTVSTLVLTNIDDTRVGGGYRCVAYFGNKPVPSSYALLNVTGMSCGCLIHMYFM